MRVTLVGMGCTGSDLLPEAEEAIARAELIVGAGRLVYALPSTTVETVVAVRAQEVATVLRHSRARRSVVVLSGDVGFFSGATGLLPLLEKDGHIVHLVPGISSVQLFAARLGRPWQKWVLDSAHGRDCDVIGLLRTGRPVFLLTSGAQTVRAICGELVDAGLGSCHVTVAENLGYADERMRGGTAETMAAGEYDSLNVMLIEMPHDLLARRRTPGLPDEAFVRGDVPMTKQEVRACALAKLGITPHAVCWDVGAGTGSVSVELALVAREVWAIERDPEAVALVRENRQRLRTWNLHVVEGTAPEALADLPRPDAVFVGGSAGRLERILDAALEANPFVRICVAAIALQTLEQAATWMDEHGFDPEVTQIAVSRTHKTGGLRLFKANNPVFLIVGQRVKEAPVGDAGA